MPLYDFRCVDCGATFEVRASIKDKEAGLTLICPVCQSQNAQQLVTAGSLLRGPSRNGGATCGPYAGPGCCR